MRRQKNHIFRSALLGLLLALIIGTTPQLSGQELEGDSIRATAETVFAEGAKFTSADVLYENLNDGDPDNDPTIISLRSAEDYAKGHIPGAVNLGLVSLFTEETLSTIPPDLPVVVVCYTGQSAAQAASALNMLGYDASSLSFGMSSWTTDPDVYVKRFGEAAVHDYMVDMETHQLDGQYELPEPLASSVLEAAAAAFENGAKFTAADVLFENLNDGDPDNDPTIISLRSAEDYAKGHVPGAVNLGLATLFTEETLSTIPADKPVVVVCYTGQSASHATSVLNMLGYDASALLHGMSSWTSDPEVYVKRFTPDTHAHDYTIDLEAHELTGSYELPEPLVEPAQTSVVSVETANVVAATAEIVFENGATFTAADALFENLNDGDPDNDPTIISLRSAEDYATGHIPGAVNLGLANLFTEETLSTIPADRPVVVVCYTGQSAAQAASALNMLGYDASSLSFGMSSWTTNPDVYVKRFGEAAVHDYRVDTEAYTLSGSYDMPEPLASNVLDAAAAAFESGAKFTAADVLFENLNDGDPDNDPTIISLRSAEDYAKGHVPGAVNLGLATLFTEETLSTIPADKPVVVVCYTGQSASHATSVLNMLGYDASALLHGMSSWTSDPAVYVKRFAPDTHAHDYAIDLETHELTGAYELPEPLVAPVAITAADTVAATAEIVFENGATFTAADVLFENLNDGDPDNDPTIISLRSAEDYAKGHIPGAVNLGLASLFTEETLSTIPPDLPVVVVCYTGQSAAQAASALNMLGYDASSLSFGMSSWTTNPDVYVKRFGEAAVHDYMVDMETHQLDGQYELPEPLASNVLEAAAAAFENGAKFTAADVLFENLNDGDPDNDPTIISLRSAEDYAKGHVPGAVNLGLTTLFTEETLSTIPADKPVVVVCYTGQSASHATSVLNMLGYDASALLHGMSSWTSDPEVYVKRFTPDTHAHDYTIDLEAHELTGSYELPDPLVKVTTQPEPEVESDQETEGMIPAAVVAANCISCHTDEKELQELAVEEEAQSELTSGEG